MAKYTQEYEARRQAKESLLAFTLYTKPDYIVNWHHKTLAEYLDEFVYGNIPRLLISAPPRHGKTELASRRLTPFLFGKYPDRRIISTSHGDRFSKKTTRDIERIMDSKLYHNIFPNTNIYNSRVKLVKGERWKRTLNEFDIVGKKGTYLGGGLRSGITGEGCDYLLIDDYLKNYKESQSKTIKNEIWDEYLNTLATRVEGANQILIIATRWANDDLIGRLLKYSNEKWEILNFEALKTEKKYSYDKRKQGQALWPYRKTREQLLKIKELSPYTYNALYQGTPPTEGGLIFKSEWWSYFDILPRGPYTIVQSWDTAFKTGESNDFSVCTTWYKFVDGYYLIDVFRKRLTYPELKKEAMKLYNKYKPNVVLIEDKASGQSLIQDFQLTAVPVIPIKADVDKIARANAETGLYESGKVKLLRGAPWVSDYQEEHEQFCEGCEFDDQVDSSTQALHYMKQSDVDFDIEAGETECDEDWH